MGGSEQGPDDEFAVQYRTVHTLEVLIPHTPGGGISGRQMGAAQQQLKRFATDYGRVPNVDEFDLAIIGRGVAALSCVVGLERGPQWAATGPVPAPAQATPVSDDGMHVGGTPRVAPQADGMDLGPGFGRAGAG